MKLMSKRKTVKIDKKQLFNSIIESQEKGELTPEAFLLIEQLTKNFISQFYYKDPMDRDDCYQTALLDCLTAWKKFDANVSNNAFSFLTQTIKIGLIKGWKTLYPGKINTISIDNDMGNGIYSI